jgi:SAM-dependent methyltransferase
MTSTSIRSRGPTEIRPFFSEPVREYALRRMGRPVAVLRAGCLAPLHELGLDRLRDDGTALTVTTVDVDHPAARPVGGSSQGIVEDLRTTPLRPRTFDIVLCAGLIEHIRGVEVVLDRLVAALRPGGLLLLRAADRECASGLLDRALPPPARRAIWRRRHPHLSGPLPRVYEPIVSARGIYDYALLRGLVIAARTAVRTEPAAPGGAWRAARLLGAIVSWATRGRRTCDHDELLYVIRKPEDRFARVV